MRVYWRYRCDYGHEWFFFRDENAEEAKKDSRCPEGHQFITRQIERPADEVQVTIRPASVMDEHTGRVFFEYMYWFVISDIDWTWERQSAKTYGWQEAITLGEKFRGKTREAAWKLWDRMKL